jgi:hypothetical protein
MLKCLTYTKQEVVLLGNGNPIDNVMTVAEAATDRGVSPQAIEYQCKKHWKREGQARKTAGWRGVWLINRAAVEAYIPDEAKKNS